MANGERHFDQHPPGCRLAAIPAVAVAAVKRRRPLARSSPMRRSTLLTRTAMARKKARVTPEEAHARKVVERRAQGVCEGCGVPPGVNGPLDWAHRVGQGVGGRWTPENGLLLCRLVCHEGQRQAKTAALAKARGWVLHSSRDPASEPAWLARHGWVLLAADGTTSKINRKAA